MSGIGQSRSFTPGCTGRYPRDVQPDEMAGSVHGNPARLPQSAAKSRLARAWRAGVSIRSQDVRSIAAPARWRGLSAGAVCFTGGANLGRT